MLFVFNVFCSVFNVFFNGLEATIINEIANILLFFFNYLLARQGNQTCTCSVQCICICTITSKEHLLHEHSNLLRCHVSQIFCYNYCIVVTQIGLSKTATLGPTTYQERYHFNASTVNIKYNFGTSTCGSFYVLHN